MIHIFTVVKLLGDQATLSIKQFAKISKVDILIVHVRLTLPVDLKNHSLHLPVNPALLVFEAIDQNVRQICRKRRASSSNALHVPCGHID